MLRTTLEDAEVIDIHFRGVVVALKIDFPTTGAANGVVEKQDMGLLVGIAVGRMTPHLFIIERISSFFFFDQ